MLLPIFFSRFNFLTFYRTGRILTMVPGDDANSAVLELVLRRITFRTHDTVCADFQCGLSDVPLSLNCCRMLKLRHKINCHLRTD